MRASDRPVPDGDDDAAAVSAAIAGLAPATFRRTNFERACLEIDGCMGQPTYAAMCMDTSPRCPHPDAIRINARRSSGGHHYAGTIEKGGNMRTQGTGNSVRQRVTRVLAAGRPAIHVRVRHGCHDRRLCCGGRLSGLRAARTGPGGGGVEAGAAAGAEVGVTVSAQHRPRRRRSHHRRRDCGERRRAAAAGCHQLLHAALSFVRSQ